MAIPYRGPVEVNIALQIYGPRVDPIFGYVEIDDIDIDDWTTEFIPTSGAFGDVHSGAATVRLIADDMDNVAAPAVISGPAGSLRLKGQGRFLPEI